MCKNRIFFSRKNDSVDQAKQELASLRQQLDRSQSRINHLEALLARPSSTDVHSSARGLSNRSLSSNSMTKRSRSQQDQSSSSRSLTTIVDDESSKDDDNETDSNMVDLTNVIETESNSSSPTTTEVNTYSTQQFSNSSAAIDILHSIIQDTGITLDLPGMKKQKVRKLNDDIEENEDYLVRPLVNKQDNFQRTFNKFGGHSSVPWTRRLGSTNSFKSKSRLSKSKGQSTRNNHKITTFFDLN